MRRGWRLGAQVVALLAVHGSSTESVSSVLQQAMLVKKLSVGVTAAQRARGNGTEVEEDEGGEDVISQLSLCTPFHRVDHDYMLKVSGYSSKHKVLHLHGDDDSWCACLCDGDGVQHRQFEPSAEVSQRGQQPLKIHTRCAKDRVAVELQSFLDQLGRPAKCIASQQMTTDNVGYGFGSVINSFIKPYTYAIAHGFTMW